MTSDQRSKLGDRVSGTTHTETAPPIGELIARHISRRAALGGIAATALLGAGSHPAGSAWAASPSSLTFPELAHGYDTQFHVAQGHEAQVVIRWGDAVVPGAPAFDPDNQTAAAQSQQFGYNNDFVAFMPLPARSKRSDHGLLCVNHEFTDAPLMFPGVSRLTQLFVMTREQVDIEMAAHGHSVVEIKRRGESWKVVADSPFNRRLTTLSTPMRLSGPAAGHRRLRTSADPSGSEVIGTLNNCAGGVTPWGTVLIAEENFHAYFGGDPEGTREARNHQRYGIKGHSRFHWSKYHDRFDVEKEPNEPNRFGWVVELDPYNPRHTPVKRTALGRFKHEAATVAVAPDGRIAVYTGDDERFEYVYRFVSDGRFDPDNRAANMKLLDMGVLSVARFQENGVVRWLPLIWGEGPLTPENGFASQADVLIETRRAADLLGATPMDRPEDIETNPVTGGVYVMLTNNTKREVSDTGQANPRAKNAHGHILELIPPGGRGAAADHTADEYRWDVFLLAGDPTKNADGAHYHPAVSNDGWLSNPDNCAFDSKGRLWIATDGAPKSGFADGVWAADVEGPGRALTRHFLHAPRGAELCGPYFTPDDTTLFVAVQHPGGELNSSFDTPSTRWPDFDNTMPPRPAVVAVTAKGRSVGS